MKQKNDRGAMIVEATIVFPVTFLVIFFMIFAGNAYLQKCRVEAIISTLALDGAAYCADPLLDQAEAGKIPGVGEHEVYPYRAFNSSGVGDIEGYISGNIDSKVAKMSTGLFVGMKPERFQVTTDYKNGLLYGTFSVDANYRIKYPIRMLFSEENMYMYVSTHVEMPVSDTTELIRNIDLIWDYMERFGVAQKLEEMISAAKEWFNR